MSNLSLYSVSFLLTIVFRYFNVYGERSPTTGQYAPVIGIFQKQKENNQSLTIVDDGLQKRDFVYVDDIINANLYALKNYDNLKGNWYEVGSGESNMFETIFDNLGLPYTYHTQSEIPKGYQFQTLSLENKWMPNWKPKFNLKKGLKEYKKYLNEKS